MSDTVFNSDEIQILLMYRNLSERNQGRVYELLVYLSEKEIFENAIKNRESIKKNK